jgi:hypothetical protein
MQRYQRARVRSTLLFAVAAALVVAWLVYMPFAYIATIQRDAAADLHDEICDNADNMSDTCVEWRAERGAP